MSWRWLQRAWAKTANPRQIRAAWKKPGLHPIDREVMRANPITPERELELFSPITPQSARMVQQLNCQVRQGVLSPTKALLKTEKGFEKLFAEKVLLEKDIEKRKAAEELDRVAKGSKKRTRFPQGHVYDQNTRRNMLQSWRNQRERNLGGGTRRSVLLGLKAREGSYFGGAMHSRPINSCARGIVLIIHVARDMTIRGIQFKN